QDGPARRCEACETTNLAGARFCKQCGASFAPPPACPSCRADIPKDARFCPGCGTKLVGLRPVRELIMPAPVTKSEAASPEPAPRVEPAREELKALADNLPRIEPKGRSSNIVGNVLLFVAACAV